MLQVGGLQGPPSQLNPFGLPPLPVSSSWGGWLHFSAVQVTSMPSLVQEQLLSTRDRSAPFADLTLANVIVIIRLLLFELFNFNPELPGVSWPASAVIN